MQTKETKEENRKLLLEAIIEETKPEKTNAWCWDGMSWDENKPILHLWGDHCTPNFTLTFRRSKGRDLVIVTPDSNPSWSKTVTADFKDLRRTAADIVACTLVIDLVGSI